MVSEAMIDASARADAAYAGRTFDALASADKVRFTERAKLMLEAALAVNDTIADLQRENAALREAIEPFAQFRTAKMPGRYTDAIGEYFVPSDFDKARTALRQHRRRTPCR